MAISDTWDFDRLVIPRLATRSFIEAGGHAFEVTGGDDGGQCPFRPATAFQQPVGEERAGAELGNGDVDGADAGVEVTVAVTVASVGAELAGGGVVRAADLVGLGGQDLVDEAL